MRKHDEAAAQYRSAIGLRECYVQAWNGLALSHALKGHGENAQELQEAFRAASTAIEINPRYENSYFLFALLCRDALKAPPRRVDPEAAKLIEEAAAKLRSGSQLRPDSTALRLAHAMACDLWGFALIAQKRDATVAADEAVRSATTALDQDASRFEPWLIRGIAHLIRGLDGRAGRDGFDKSTADFAEAAKRAPDNALIPRWLGYRHFAAGDFAAAARSWRRAVELDPNLRGEL